MVIALLFFHELDRKPFTDWIDYSSQIVLQEEDAVLQTRPEGCSIGVTSKASLHEVDLDLLVLLLVFVLFLQITLH